MASHGLEAEQGTLGRTAPDHNTQATRDRRDESAERLRDFAEAASDWFWEMGADLRFTFLSDRVRDVTGVDAAYFLGKRRDEIADTAAMPEAYAAHQDDLDNRRPFRDFVYVIRTPGGDIRTLKISGKPVFDSAGTFRGYRGTGTDITDLTESHARLQKTSTLLRTTLEYMNQGISVTDADMNLVLWNDRFLDLLEFPRDLPWEGGRPFADFVRYNAERGEYGPGDVEELVHQRVEAAKKFEPHSFERTRPDGTVVEVIGRPLPEGGFVTTYTDVTEHKRKEQLLREQADEMTQLITELKRSNAELEQFAYVASHDLQEPLRIVAGYCQLLERRYADKLDEDAREFISYAVDGANRMQALINALLHYSRIGRGERAREAVDFEELVDETLRNLGRKIRDSGARVSHDPLPTVPGDPSELCQLLQNLVSNAIKFRGADSPLVHIGAERERTTGDWVFSVSDNGIGIAPDHSERIFQIFQRLHTREAYPGTGIGLSVCKKIVESHGGRIWVESGDDGGSIFRFTLPAMTEKARQ